MTDLFTNLNGSYARRRWRQRIERCLASIGAAVLALAALWVLVAIPDAIRRADCSAHMEC